MVLFFVILANSVLFHLENGSSPRIQSLRYHGVGSLLSKESLSFDFTTVFFYFLCRDSEFPKFDV